MEETSSEEFVTAPSSQTNTADLASQLSSFFAQNPVTSSTSSASSSTLTQDFVRAIDSLAPLSSTSESPATSTQQATLSSSSNQPLQSPSPSDTLAPLLLSNLQLPSGVSIAHDHPHTSTSQRASTAPVTTSTPQQGTSSSIPTNMLTPTTITTATGSGSLSIAASNTTPAEVESSQTSENSSSIDPTFLAALPLSIRQEVLAQHRREQRASQPVAAVEQQEVEPPFQSSISPEFLSALPSNIQTEVSEWVSKFPAIAVGSFPCICMFIFINV